MTGIQFDTLFTDGLYGQIGKTAIAAADRIRGALTEKGYRLASQAPTNQIFLLLTREKAEALSEQIDMGFWENTGDGHIVMRIATSWATWDEDVDRLIEIL